MQEFMIDRRRRSVRRRTPAEKRFSTRRSRRKFPLTLSERQEKKPADLLGSVRLSMPQPETNAAPTLSKALPKAEDFGRLSSDVSL
jgi:hypothetical protein